MKAANKVLEIGLAEHYLNYFFIRVMALECIANFQHKEKHWGKNSLLFVFIFRFFPVSYCVPDHQILINGRLL